ncbi:MULTISPECIES: UDP-N-acetylmuramoyl-L-alanine--D-glutamate ligase [Chroococcidiopsis]|uniref:UDP-N-acetylmuramoylalanine--D-glutamate ligase n=1 Tax=Chroococcidiopsis thermalis (strain PCC 7203) TaxID=251229 RepID=K9U7W2_CHRTP|nr:MULTISPECIES: UDP-N-acetylmuramoyl-L-alanine--D-glutamate ligase [Chroococcidiopsis]AFY90299.1 UDP-N-acetylmuramoylalanine--D-glutamate ligase [Chroococcidiopsis thermalis PCC 7203]PSM47633.1 UDP-N-acetylmuramoyl-L-alanine--D-glutamate ligase [Chroococcidiopsis sp. CCALA 051]
MSNACVIGLGKSGVAAARLLKREGWQVILSDRSDSASLRQQQQQLAAEGIPVRLGHTPSLDSTDSPQLIVVSPGVPWDADILNRARALGIETIGEMELAWRYLNAVPWVGITGTNGKTTTTALVAAIFQTAGLNAPACGNIGHAVCDVALEFQNNSRGAQPYAPTKYPDWIIAEISSYQIESAPSVAPRIGVWTTFTPDHLSRHKTLERYYDIKAHLVHQSQLQVINGDDAFLSQEKLNDWQDAYWTSVKGKAFLNCSPDLGTYIEDDWVIFGQEQIVQVSALRMVGAHNLQNLLMAVAVARLAGIDKEAIATAIATFPGVPHRLEHICTWQGIDFINDSKATNYDAAQVGLSSVTSPAILIAGGEAKIGDDLAWLQTIQAQAAAVLLIGDAAPAFASRLSQVGYNNYEIVETMARAVSRAAELAPQYQARVVLLSPACASFDRYQNFEQRGDDFRQLCMQLVQ